LICLSIGYFRQRTYLVNAWYVVQSKNAKDVTEDIKVDVKPDYNFKRTNQTCKQQQPLHWSPAHPRRSAK